MVWLDENADGERSGNEQPYPTGTTVQLLSSEGTEIMSVATNSSGYYLFENVTPGLYTVQVTPRTGQHPPHAAEHALLLPLPLAFMHSSLFLFPLLALL